MTDAALSSTSLSPLIFYQAKLLKEVMEHNVTVIEKSRRIGISWVLSWLAVTVAAAMASAGGMDVFYMGYEKNMTRQFIDDCAAHAKILCGIDADVEEEIFPDPAKPDKFIHIFRIKCASGFEIQALPSVPRAFRSKQGLVILDEAAFVDDLAAMIKAALALRIWGAKIIILSTHDGEENPFNRLVQEIRGGKKNYHLIRITFDEAVAQGLYRKICEKQGIEWTAEGEKAWYDEIISDFGDDADEELHVIPSKGGGTYIPLALIIARTVAGTPVIRWACKSEFTLLDEKIREGEALRFCEEQLAPLLDRLDRKTQHALGEDFARSGDLTVLWPLAIERTLLRRTPFVVELRNVPFEQQKQILWFILDRLPLLRGVKLDARGNGQWLAEVTVQKYGARAEAVMLSESWYRENMPPFKAAFEEGHITVPDDQPVRDDLHSLKIIRGVGRVPESKTDDSDGKRHGDAAIAGCLAYAASNADPEIYEYTPAPSPFAIEGRPSERGGWPIEDELAAERAGVRMDNMGLRGSIY